MQEIMQTIQKSSLSSQCQASEQISLQINPHQIKYQSSIFQFSKRYRTIIEQQLNHYKKVKLRNFVLRRREIVSKGSREYLVDDFDKRSQLTEDMLREMLYYAVGTLYELFDQQFYLLSPLQFCLLVQNTRGPTIIFKEAYVLLKARIIQMNQDEKQQCNEYYPVQLILKQKESKENLELIDRLIMAQSLVRLFKRIKKDTPQNIELVQQILNMRSIVGNRYW